MVDTRGGGRRDEDESARGSQHALQAPAPLGAPGLDPTALLQLFAPVLQASQANSIQAAQQLLSQQLAQLQTSTPSTSHTSGSISRTVHNAPKNAIKLPTFAGEISGSKRYAARDVQEFLQRVEAYYDAHGTSFASDQLRLHALYDSFPAGSKALSWFAAQLPSLTDISSFRTAFQAEFAPSQEEQLRLRTQYIGLKQRDRETPRAFYEALIRLRRDLEVIGDRHTEAEIAVKFVQGLLPRLHTEVFAVFTRNPHLTPHQLLLEAESEQHKLNTRTSTQPTPRLHAMQRRGKRCPFCKSTEHATFSECPKVAQRKKQGKWQERARPDK